MVKTNKIISAQTNLITKCRLKEDKGCFPAVGGIVFECPDTDTCPESTK